MRNYYTSTRCANMRRPNPSTPTNPSARLLLISKLSRPLPPAAIMTNDMDRISSAEMFSDIYKIWRSQTACAWRWRGRWSLGQKVTPMSRSLVEVPLLKAPHWQRCRKHKKPLVLVLSEPSLAGIQLHKRSLQEVRPRLYEIGQT